MTSITGERNRRWRARHLAEDERAYRAREAARLREYRRRKRLGLPNLVPDHSGPRWRAGTTKPAPAPAPAALPVAVPTTRDLRAQRREDRRAERRAFLAAIRAGG